MAQAKTLSYTKSRLYVTAHKYSEDGLRKMTARTQKVKVKPMKVLTTVCTKKSTSFYNRFVLIVIYTVRKAKKKKKNRSYTT